MIHQCVMTYDARDKGGGKCSQISLYYREGFVKKEQQQKEQQSMTLFKRF